MKPHLDTYHQEKNDKETDNEGDDEGTDTDKDGKSTDDESKKGDGKADRDPADTEHEDNYDVMMGMWIPKRHLLECAIFQYELEYGEGSATDLRREFATRYGATSPCLAKAIENYKRFNNTKKATPKMLFNSGKSFEEWAEQKPIWTGVDAERKNVPSYDASISLVGLPDSKPDDKTGVGVCKWGERWYNKNKRLPDKLTVKCPPRWIGKGKDGHWFPNVQELEPWARAVAYALFYASCFVDRKEIKIVYEGIYQRYCEKGKFADNVFEEMFKEFRTNPNQLEGDFHELDILLVKYLYTVMPPEIVREINERNDRLWEECQLELNGKQIMLMCFKYRKIYNYQRQATSILDIHNLVYYGDSHMDAWLRAVKDIIFHSHDIEAFKIDNSDKGQDSMRFFRDKVYKLR